jgi:8-oxo-dGTP pyrophosphatase MutT (NUDIX family)
MPSPQHRFLDALTPSEKQQLQSLAANARQAPPPDWVRWYCGPVFLGWLSPQRALWLSQTLECTSLSSTGLQWDAMDCSAEVRSAKLQAALEVARLLGLLTGWRNERFSFWTDPALIPAPDAPYFLSVERSGYRFLGMMSHAVHINGFTREGYVWCGRRALSKATDPGMLDNVTAGGLPTGESALDCALRELEEEAGLAGLPAPALMPAGSIRTARAEPQGYHDELLQVFNLVLPANCVPVNRDGEVSEFMRLSPTEVMARIARGEFTADAAATLAQGLAQLTHG